MHLFTKLALLLLILSLAACRQTAEQQSEPPSETPSREASATATIPAPTPMPQAATATATQAPTDTPAVTPTAASTTTPTAWPTPASLPLPMSQEISFEIMAHEGGHVHSVAATGNIAYVGIGPRLVMLDVANPGNAQPIARSSVLPGLVHAILPGENAIYAAAGQHLVTLEMGDGELNVVAELQLPGGISYLIRVGELLYSAGSVPVGPDEQPTGFLAVIAPTENGDLALVDAPFLPAAVRGVAQAGDLLYLALDGKWRDNFIAFDLTSGPFWLSQPLYQYPCQRRCIACNWLAKPFLSAVTWRDML